MNANFLNLLRPRGGQNGLSPNAKRCVCKVKEMNTSTVSSVRHGVQFHGFQATGGNFSFLNRHLKHFNVTINIRLFLYIFPSQVYINIYFLSCFCHAEIAILNTGHDKFRGPVLYICK